MWKVSTVCQLLINLVKPKVKLAIVAEFDRLSEYFHCTLAVAVAVYCQSHTKQIGLDHDD